MKAVINAHIITCDENEGEFFGYVTYDGGKIVSVSKGDYKPSGDEEEITDARGGYVLPGLIDAHTHLGNSGDASGFESDDINDINDPCTPHFSSLDSVNPFDRCFEDARNAGVTTVLTGPGSANALGGSFIAVKTDGKRIDKMILRAPCSMKMALGENPKMCYHEKDESPETRMATAAIIREALKKASRYLEAVEQSESDENADPPEFDAKCEALLPVLRREIPLHIHAHRADDIFTGIRIAKEFSLDYVLVHCTEGHLIARELKEENARVMSGPFFCDRSKPELRELTPACAGILEKEGVEVSRITDHSVTPIQYLILCASLAVKNGMSRQGAINAVTINPAKFAGISDRVGSITPGKDADLAVYSGDPLDFYSKTVFVAINGRTVKNEL